MALPTQAELLKLFSYDKVTGEVTRRIKIRGCKYPAGSVVGASNSHGYHVVRVKDQLMGLHRVIWCMVYGYYPEHVIDHINRKRADNRLENLREATVACNVTNHKKFVTNKSGVTGVCWDSTRDHWVAYVSIRLKNVKRRTIHLVKTLDFFEAVCYRLAGEQCLGYDKCNAQTSAARYVKNALESNKTTGK